jgi:hypothetical protein
LAPRLQQYEQQFAHCGDRNSFSQTDPDATFMRLKEDHMRNGQLQPAYNVHMGTEKPFIIGYRVHQNRTDAGCLLPHLERLHTLVGRLPQTLGADAGYGSEENFAYVEKQGRTALIKWNPYRLEGTRKWPRQVKRAENWTYDDTRDEWICAAGRRLTFQGLKPARSDNGYRATLRVYQAHDCPTCPLKAECTTAEYRRIQISPLLRRYQQDVRERLKVPEVMAIVKRRGVEGESVWGHINEDRQFRRCPSRGLAKVQTEWGLLSVAHNLLKQATLASEERGSIEFHRRPPKSPERMTIGTAPSVSHASHRHAAAAKKGETYPRMVRTQLHSARWAGTPAIPGVAPAGRMQRPAQSPR